jgi:NAD(P)H-hydrate epimerase
MKKLNKTYVKSILKLRKSDSHKGTYGHALIIAGSMGKMGAAMIASKACLRSGIGLLTVNVPEDERQIIQNGLPEAMIAVRQIKLSQLESFQSIGIGPGLGTDKKSERLVRSALSASIPLVLDADALNVISKKKWITIIPKESIITPHSKEFDRLFGEHKSKEERRQKAIKIAKECGIIIVLKGHETFICGPEISFINTSGNAGLAKGGSGDALTGIIAAFLAQGYMAIDAALIGVYIHGLAADICLKEQSMESMLIGDVIENLGNAFKKIAK